MSARRRWPDEDTRHCARYGPPLAIDVIARHPDRPERLALWHRDGTLSTWFARDGSREAVAVLLGENGMLLEPDDSVLQMGKR